MTRTFGLAFVLATSACGAAAPSAVATGSDTAPGILVTGRGEAEAAPDVAVVNLGVEVREPTVAAARDGAASTQRAVLDALRAAGLEDRDLRTTQLSVAPDYEHTEAGRRLLGYVVHNTVEARVRDLSRVQEAIDGAVAAGGDRTRLDGLRFELSNPDAVQREARASAIERARSEAQQIADALGARLGEPLAVEELGDGAGPQPLVMRMAEAAQDVATPIEPGATRVAVEVRVRWAIAR